MGTSRDHARGTGLRPASWTVGRVMWCISTFVAGTVGLTRSAVAMLMTLYNVRALGLVITRLAPLAISFPNAILERDTARAGREAVLATVAAAHLGGLPRVDAGEAEGEGEDEALEHCACGLRITSNGMPPSRRQGAALAVRAFVRLRSQSHRLMRTRGRTGSRKECKEPSRKYKKRCSAHRGADWRLEGRFLGLGCGCVSGNAGCLDARERINEPHYSLIKTHSLEQPHAIFVRREQFQRAPRTA